jgi:hypothetical protein
MFQHMGIDDKIDGFIRERQTVAPGNNVHFGNLIYDPQLLLL